MSDLIDRQHVIDVLVGVVGHFRDIPSVEDNPPLAWDDLKQMQGKPVWIEHLETETPHGEWTIVQTPATFGDVYLVTRCRDRYVLYENDLGKTWQAYRKER